MKPRLGLRHGHLGRKEVTSHEAFREASSWSFPTAHYGTALTEQAQRQHVELTMHSAEDEASHNGLSAFPISCCTFIFMVGTSSQVHVWSAVINLPWHEVILHLEKDEAAAAYEMR